MCTLDGGYGLCFWVKVKADGEHHGDCACISAFPLCLFNYRLKPVSFVDLKKSLLNMTIHMLFTNRKTPMPGKYDRAGRLFDRL